MPLPFPLQWSVYVEELLAGDTALHLKRMNISQIKQYVATDPPDVCVPLVPKVSRIPWRACRQQ